MRGWGEAGRLCLGLCLNILPGAEHLLSIDIYEHMGGEEASYA